MSMCEHCGGLIAEPNKAYGWAGKWCHCAPTTNMGETYHPSRQAEIEELRRRLARLEERDRRDGEVAWQRLRDERDSWVALQDTASRNAWMYTLSN